MFGFNSPALHVDSNAGPAFFYGAMQVLVAVRFLIPFANYNIGDVAGFPEERAQAMVKSKIAELFVVPKPRSKSNSLVKEQNANTSTTSDT